MQTKIAFPRKRFLKSPECIVNQEVAQTIRENLASRPTDLVVDLGVRQLLDQVDLAQPPHFESAGPDERPLHVGVDEHRHREARRRRRAWLDHPVRRGGELTEGVHGEHVAEVHDQ